MVGTPPNRTDACEQWYSTWAYFLTAEKTPKRIKLIIIKVIVQALYSVVIAVIKENKKFNIGTIVSFDLKKVSTMVVIAAKQLITIINMYKSI